MPNERLIDSHLAEKFQVSRSPIREALRKLEQEGLIVNDSGVITVYNPSLQDFIELYQVRSGLESVAAYWATLNIDEVSIQKLSQSLVETEIALEKKNYEKVISLNTYFHNSILEASKNQRLKVMMENIKDLIQLYRRILFNNQTLDYNFLQDHKNILNAIIEKDPTKASRYMEDHIRNDMEYFKRIL